jgi:predicted nuclease with TOPRIM domain
MLTLSNKELMQSNKELTQKVDTLTKNNVDLTQKVDALTENNIELMQSNTDLMQSNKELMHSNKELTKNNAELTQKVDTLTDSVSILRGIVVDSKSEDIALRAIFSALRKRYDACSFLTRVPLTWYVALQKLSEGERPI